MYNDEDAKRQLTDMIYGKPGRPSLKEMMKWINEKPPTIYVDPAAEAADTKMWTYAAADADLMGKLTTPANQTFCINGVSFEATTYAHCDSLPSHDPHTWDGWRAGTTFFCAGDIEANWWSA